MDLVNIRIIVIFMYRYEYIYSQEYKIFAAEALASYEYD